MKKLILLLFTVVLILSCGNKTDKPVSDTDSLAVDSVADASLDKHSDSCIQQRIDTVYKTVGESMHEKVKDLVGYWGWVGDDCPELLLRLEMTDKGLEVTECNIYRMYGFDKATATFNGTDLTVYEQDYDEEAMIANREFHFDAHFDKNGDLTGDCYIKHPLAKEDYEGPLTLRKDYFKYSDGVK